MLHSLAGTAKSLAPNDVAIAVHVVRVLGHDALGLKDALQAFLGEALPDALQGAEPALLLRLVKVRGCLHTSCSSVIRVAGVVPISE